jgi:hypothetical protein
MSSAPRLNKPITMKKVILQASRSTGYPMKSKSTFGKILLGAALCAATVLLATSPTHAALIFTENFNYTTGDNLAGKNGGTGFSGAWSGGSSTIVAGLGGTGNAVAVGSSTASRPLSSSYNTSGNTFYISYLMNTSDFFGGDYVGLSLWNNSTEEMFIGIPWQARKFGFDAHGGTGAGGIKSVDFTPLVDTTYLVTLGLLPSSTSGKVDVKMWATDNLSANPNTLVSGPANASLLGTRNNFTFNTLKLNGNYGGALKIAGLADATTAAEAINATVQSAVAVPEPGQVAASLLLLAGIGGYVFLKRRTAAKAPSPAAA